jgi:hypothetical protein
LEKPTKRIFRSILVIWLIGLGLFLSLRATHPDRWSDWYFGDSQTMLAAQNYAKEGFLKLRFLWVPQGYSAVSEFLDRDDLRHHAHGTWGHFSGLPQFRAYTHWPSWYAVPYGVFAKFGIWNKSIYQCFSILLSITGLFFLFLFLRGHLGTPIAATSVIIYTLHPGFLSFCDSLANHPCDDFFRFLFMYLWASPHSQKFSYGPFLTAYIFAMTSLDSLIFLPLFAVLYDLCIRKQVRTKAWFVLALCLLFALISQSIQNSSYFGVGNTFADWRGYFLNSSQHSFWERFPVTITLLEKTLALSHWSILLGWGLVLFVTIRSHSLLTRLTGILLTSGMGFPLVFPGKADMLYETRQFLPAIAVGIAGALVVTFSPKGKRKVFNLIAMAFSPLFLFPVISQTRSAIDYPPRPRIEISKRVLFEKIAAAIPGDKVYFQLGEENLSQNYFGYGQISPLIEFYSKGLYLHFPNPEALFKDLQLLTSLKPNGFVPILVFNPKESEQIKQSIALSANLFPSLTWLPLYEAENTRIIALKH